MPDRSCESDSVEERHDYLAFAIGGVQEFVSAARTTADLWAASDMVQRLAVAARDAVLAGGGTVLIPVPSARSVPNRLWARLPHGTASATADSAADAVASTWTRLAGSAPPPRTSWVAVEDATYGEAWETAGKFMAARKLVRDFAPYEGGARTVCSMCARYASIPAAPGDAARRGGRIEPVCGACAAKREYGRNRDGTGGVIEPFPSTSSIAAMPFLDAVEQSIRRGNEDAHDAANRLDAALDDLAPHVPYLARPPLATGDPMQADAALARLRAYDGSWLYEDAWADDTAAAAAPGAGADAIRARGREALRGLTHAVDARPKGYLAVIAIDGDDMGVRLSARASEEQHRLVGEALSELSLTGFATAAATHNGRVVYAGGDDLLAFAPVGPAVGLAAACCDQVAATIGQGATASAGVVLFHRTYPLRDALARVRAALADAKRYPGKNAVSVVALRRGGERGCVTLPWRLSRGTRTDEAFMGLVDAFRGGLSPRLAGDLAAIVDELDAAPRALVSAEVTRLARRHGAGDNDADVLARVATLGTEADSARCLGLIDTALFVMRER